MNRIALAVAMIVPTLAFAGVPEDAKARTEKFIDRLMAVKSVEKGELPKADKDANAKVFTELDGFFDWDYLMSEPIKTRIDKFSAAEKEEFHKKFREVLRMVAYPDSGSFFRKAKWKLTAPKADGADKAIVGIDAKRDDLETHVDIHWKKVGDTLKLYDVSFDGDSLVKDYQNQMARIIDKEGAKGLLAKIDKRKADLEKPKK